MCGIAAFWGNRNAVQKVIGSLKALSYRGYDSYGFAAVTATGLCMRKDRGDISLLSETGFPDARSCIGHTRWATHGIPSKENAHPHLSCDKKIAIVHNGAIENVQKLKSQLSSHTFVSETDSEVIAHLIEEQLSSGRSFFAAFRSALLRLHGSFAIACMDLETGEILAATNGPPLVLGKSEHGVFLASDAIAFLKHTTTAIHLSPFEMVVLSSNRFFDYRTEILREKRAEVLEWRPDAAGKGFFEHFMLKEITEQPAVIQSLLARHVTNNKVVVPATVVQTLSRASRIILLGCGTSSYAARLGSLWFEGLARVQSRAEYASEFKYANPVLLPGDCVIALSQSGETADTLGSVHLAREKQIPVITITNSPGSSMERNSDCTLQLGIGPEIAVAATKSFTATCCMLLLLALSLKQEKGQDISPCLKELYCLPEKMRMLLSRQKEVAGIAAHFSASPHALFLGRGFEYPIALEAALKLKEIAYIHAEGEPAAEIKHGPIALIDATMPVFFIAPNDARRDKIISNIQEVRARKGIVTAVYTEGDAEIKSLCDHSFALPASEDWCFPLLSVLPFQLFAYYTALKRGCSIDKPKNLAKSVTVE